MAETHADGSRPVTSRWFTPGTQFNHIAWRGRVEVIGNHTRVWHQNWPVLSRDTQPITQSEIDYCIRTKWWIPVDTDLELDIGL